MTTRVTPEKFQVACDWLSKRGTLMVIRAMLAGANRHGDILRAVPDLNSKTLVKRLRELEDAGIVRRIVYPNTPVRIEYCLTLKGTSLDMFISDFERWVSFWVTSKLPPA